MLLFAVSRTSFHGGALALRPLGLQGRQQTQQRRLFMGLFDFFGPKRTASASHILVKGPEAPEFLVKLKGEINSSPDVPIAFAEAAAKFSACPSGQRGGSLGTFREGQMVPAFDKVVFTEEIGLIHGPIQTPFGAHLIYIAERSEKPEKK